MSPLPTTFALERDDRRSHIDLRHAPLAEKDDSMSPEQFAELKALLTDMLAPVKELAERQLVLLSAPLPPAADPAPVTLPDYVEQAEPLSIA